MTSALFTINGGTAGQSADVSASSTVNLALADTSGVRSVAWRITGTDSESHTAPVITKTGAPSGITASFPVPAGLGQAYGIECVVNGGKNSNGQVDNALTSRSAVYVPYSSGRKPFFLGETTESNSVYGWTERINEVVAEQSGVLDHDLDMDGYDIIDAGTINALTTISAGTSLSAGTFADIGSYLEVGTTPATSGTIRVPSIPNIRSRNHGNTGNIDLLTTDSSDRVIVGGTGNTNGVYLNVDGTNRVAVSSTNLTYAPNGVDQRLAISNTLGQFSFSGGNVTFGGGYIGIGSNTAATGNLRVANNTTIIAARNAANNADLSIALSDLSNNLAFGSNNSPGVYFDASSAHYFRIASSAVMTVSSAGVSSPAFADSAGTTSVTGLIRAKNNTTIVAARNAANSADVNILSLSNANRVQLGGTNTVGWDLNINSGAVLQGDGGALYVYGGQATFTAGQWYAPAYTTTTANPATSGLVRAANNTAIVATRNAANNANLEVIGSTSANALYVGGGAAATATIKTYGWNANGLIQTIVPQASATVTNTVYHEYVFGFTTNTSGAVTNTDLDLSNIEGISFASGTTAVYARIEHIAYRATSNFATYATCEQLFRYNGTTWVESGTADATTTRDAAGNAFTTPTLAMSANLLRYSCTAPATTEVVTHRIKFKVTAMKA